MPDLVSDTRTKIPAGHERLAGHGGHDGGVHWNAGSDFAYHIGAAYSVYTKNANRWVIGGEYLHKKYDYKDMRIPVEQFTAEGGYYLNSFGTGERPFPLAGLSLLPGMKPATGATSCCRTGLRCWTRTVSSTAVRLTLELETNLTDRVVLLVNARERMLFGSDIGKFHTQVAWD